MLRSVLTTAAMALSVTVFQTPAFAQRGHPKLHVNTRWKSCSFQLDSSLKQSAWHQFTQEAGLVAYFRPVADAQPMGKGNFEVSMLQWQTGINDSVSAWNDTFVHPDSMHWLTEGSGLAFPGLMVRAGLTDRTDVDVYFTKNAQANYGFFGAALQRELIGDATGTWRAAGRMSFVKLYGPSDLDFTIYGADLVASRSFQVSRWAEVSPYAGVSSYLAASHEKSPVVDLRDEHVLGAQATVGASLRLSKARLAAEYGVAKVSTLSLKIGFGT